MYDVAVVGAGPAGSMAAYRLAKKGYSVLLIERKSFPKNKPCGGGFSMHAMSYCDFDFPDEILERAIFGGKLSYNGEGRLSLLDRPSAYLTQRTKLDHFLVQQAEKAGAQLLENTRCLGVINKKDRISLKLSTGLIDAKICIIANGVFSKIAHKVRKPFADSELAVAIEAEYPVSEKEINKERSNFIEVQFGDFFMGYGWIFPKKDHYNIGIGGEKTRLQDPKKALVTFCQNNGFDKDKLQNERGYLLPIGGIKRPITADRMLLVGDAAGFVDALTGEGLGYAIQSATIAADVVNTQLQLNAFDKDDLCHYELRCKYEIMSELKVAYLLSKLMHKYPYFLKMFMLEKDIIEKYMKIQQATYTYKEFFNWIVLRLPYFILKRIL